jgi:CRISPR/Cas system-associated protein Csx1
MVHKVISALLAIQALRGRKVLLVLRGLQVMKVRQELLALQDQRGRKVQQVRMVCKVTKVRQAQQALKVTLVILEPQALKDQ